MRVFITGGAGFIGSYLCKALVKEGNEVIVLDNFSTGSAGNISQIKNKISLFQGDIKDKVLVEKLTKNSDLILHMAAAVGVKNILENTINSILTNFYGSEVVLNAALKFDKRIVIASTSEVYGKNSKSPLSESDDRILGTPQKLRWTYSDAKALEEAMAYSMYLNQNLKLTTVRLFNTVGPLQSGKYGMVIPRFVDAAISNQPLQIFGDGTQTRVFCHVKDAVTAILSLSLDDSSIGKVFNIGGKEEISILNLAKLVISLSKSSSKLIFINYSEAYTTGYEDILRRVPDLRKIHTQIGWKPTFTIDQIINDVIREKRS